MFVVVHVCASLCVWVHVQVEVRDQSFYYYYFFFETRVFSLNPSLMYLDKLAGQFLLNNPVVSTSSPRAGLTGMYQHTQLLIGFLGI